MSIVIFTDSQSVLQAIENQSVRDEAIKSLSKKISNTLQEKFCRCLILQWIPSHCEIPGNDKADNLAKIGAKQQQPNTPVSQRTCKQILKGDCKERWLKEWALCDKGRKYYTFRQKPCKEDPINTLRRRDQVIIFRLRTEHVPLNMHLNRINPEHPPLCELCEHPYETVEHVLFQCHELKNLRDKYLPDSPDLENTLYSSAEQLVRTATFYNMAIGRRAKAHMAAGSVK